MVFVIAEAQVQCHLALQGNWYKGPPQIGKKTTPLKSALVLKKQLTHIQLPLILLINKNLKAQSSKNKAFSGSLVNRT